MSMPESEVEGRGMGWKRKKKTKEVDEAWRKRCLNYAPGKREARKEGADSKQ